MNPTANRYWLYYAALRNLHHVAMMALEAKMDAIADADGLVSLIALQGAVTPDRTSRDPA